MQIGLHTRIDGVHQRSDDLFTTEELRFSSYSEFGSVHTFMYTRDKKAEFD